MPPAKMTGARTQTAGSACSGGCSHTKEAMYCVSFSGISRTLRHHLFWACAGPNRQPPPLPNITAAHKKDSGSQGDENTQRLTVAAQSNCSRTIQLIHLSLSLSPSLNTECAAVETALLQHHADPPFYFCFSLPLTSTRCATPSSPRCSEEGPAAQTRVRLSTVPHRCLCHRCKPAD
jgi:hypothetical protein